MASLPTKRSLEDLRKRGFLVHVVERYNAYSRRKVDLFNFGDVIAIHPEHGIVAVQCCAGCDHSKRLIKMALEPKLDAWFAAGGQAWLMSWAKRGARGKRKLWTLREERLTPATMASVRLELEQMRSTDSIGGTP